MLTVSALCWFFFYVYLCQEYVCQWHVKLPEHVRAGSSLTQMASHTFQFLWLGSSRYCINVIHIRRCELDLYHNGVSHGPLPRPAQILGACRFPDGNLEFCSLVLLVMHDLSEMKNKIISFFLSFIRFISISFPLFTILLFKSLSPYCFPNRFICPSCWNPSPSILAADGVDSLSFSL